MARPEFHPVNVDRRGAGDDHGWFPAPTGFREHPGPQSRRWRDLGDDRGGELAGRRPQVLFPAAVVGAGVEVGGDGRGVVGVVGVEGIGGEVVR